MKNRKNDRSDASLQLDHRAMFIVPVGARPPIKEGYLCLAPSSPLGMVSERGGIIVPPHCLRKAHRS
jgi:hypothetical protein